MTPFWRRPRAGRRRADAPEFKDSRAGPMIALHGTGRPRWTPRDYASLADEGFVKNPVAYRCVRMIAEAAQTYGFIVSDTSGAVAVITESGAREAAVTGVDPWKELLGMPSYDVLKGFPWDRVQVVERDYGQL